MYVYVTLYTHTAAQHCGHVNVAVTLYVHKHTQELCRITVLIAVPERCGVVFSQRQVEAVISCQLEPSLSPPRYVTITDINR